MALPVATSVDRLLAELARGAHENDGEAVNLLDHGLQCAAILETEDPADRELQIAGLVHDVGTILWPNRPKTHARSGAAFVEPLLGTRVGWLVAHHDEAKRYLVTTDPDYVAQLSAHSLETLEHQGGTLTSRECARLRDAPWFEELLALRRADDHAKTPDRDVPELSRWRGTLERLARRATRTA
jgi:predicted HD phosphohydrolase